MKTFARSIEIEAPRVWLFEVMQDYGRRLAWDEFLSRAELVGEAREAGLGVRALCVDTQGRAMETEYVSFRPPERVAVKMTQGPWMFGAFAGAWIYRELEACRTEVTFRYSMSLGFRALGSFGDALLSKAFSLDMGRRLASAKRRLEALYREDLAGAPAHADGASS